MGHTKCKGSQEVFETDYLLLWNLLKTRPFSYCQIVFHPGNSPLLACVSNSFQSGELPG